MTPPSARERFKQRPGESDTAYLARRQEAAFDDQHSESPLEGFLVSAPPPNELVGLGFAEAYWADIPRGPAKDCYVLDESKKWAQSVVERVRQLDKDHP